MGPKHTEHIARMDTTKIYEVKSSGVPNCLKINMYINRNKAAIAAVAINFFSKLENIKYRSLKKYTTATFKIKNDRGTINQNRTAFCIR